MHRLSKIKNEGSELSQKIFDIVFRDLDYSLRELGAGDVSVANNMKKLISSYMGRQKTYIKAFKNDDEKFLELAFKNNIYRNNEQNGDYILSLSRNIFRINKRFVSLKINNIFTIEFFTNFFICFKYSICASFVFFFG